MSVKILFVDDEPNVLQSIKRTLRKSYEMDTAASGKEALVALEQSGPYAVVVSDMQMPEMNGAQLLAHVKERAPATARIMLTGNADQQTAVDAINHGDILRFLSKPTSPEELKDALEAGLAHHHLVQAEKELLEDTLRGSVAALAEVLALSNPEVFGRSMRLKDRVQEVATEMQLTNIWQLETIALLSQIGCISIPLELVKRKMAGGQLTAEDQVAFSFHASVGADLLGKIPRMEDVAAAVRYQEKYYDGSGTPRDGVKGEDIPAGARVLRAVLDLDAYEAAGEVVEDAFARLRKHAELYDPAVLTALETVITNDDEWEIHTLELSALTDEFRLASDIFTTTGTLLVAKGQATTLSVRRHLRNYCDKGQVPEHVDVWQKVAPTVPEIRAQAPAVG